MAVVTDPAPNAPYQQGEPRDTVNLAVIDCRGRLAAQGNPVGADDVDAYEWVLLIDPAAVPP
jgi:hypothetical protein